MKNPFLIACVSISVLIRILLFFIVDLSHQNAWEYGIIAQNLLAGKGYSFFYLAQGNLIDEFNFLSNAQPSAYMPPGYVLLLVPFYLIGTEWIRTTLIFIMHNILSLAATYFYGQAIAVRTNRNVAQIGMAIMLLLPEFIYANFTIGTTVLYHFLLSIIFYLLAFNSRKGRLFLIAFVFAVGIMVRSELFLFFAAILLIWVFETRYKQAAITAVLVAIMCAPWAIRNYLVFDKFIPFTTNSGINLYRGNNLEEIGTWPQALNPALYNNIIIGSLVEPRLNTMYLNDGITIMAQHPQMALKWAVIKVFRFWVIDWSEPRTHHILYWCPWFLLLACSLLGICKFSNWQKYKFEYIFLVCSTSIVVIFFPLVRYQTMMKFVLVPFAAMGITFLFKNLFKRLVEKTTVHNES